MDSTECTLPAEFLLNIDDVPAVAYFTDQSNNVLSSQESEKRIVFEGGRYIQIDPSLRAIIQGSKEEKLKFVADVIITNIKQELQFGNVLTYPNISDDLESLIISTLSEYDPLQFINEITLYSKKAIKRSIFACGVGIALALFSQYEEDIAKAIGMGCLLHEYGYVINPQNHTVAGCNSLEMRAFSYTNSLTRIILEIIEHHHSIKPHDNPSIDCGKIAIHWASQEDSNQQEKIALIRARKRIYHSQIMKNFEELFSLMLTRKQQP